MRDTRDCGGRRRRGAPGQGEGRRDARERGLRSADARLHHLTVVGSAPRLASRGAVAAPGAATDDRVRRRRVRSLLAGGAAFLLAVISLAVWSLHKATTISAFERRLECAQAVWGSVEEGFDVDAVIVREEKVFVSPLAGEVRLAVREGERVRAGTLVAEVVREDARQVLEPPLASAREQLSEFDAYARARLDELRREVATRRLEAENEERAVGAAKRAGDVRGEEQHKNALASASALAAAAAGRLQAEEEALRKSGKELAAKVQACEEAYGEAVCALRAEAPGVVSFELDGLEAVLTPASAGGLAPDGVRTLSGSTVRTTDGAEVAEGQPVFRVVDNYRLLMLVLLSADEASTVASSRIRIRLLSQGAGGGLFPARVVSQGDPAPSGERGVLLEVEGFPPELCRVRHTRARLVTRSAQGLAIPRRSVVHDGSEQYVYAPVNLGVMKRLVEVIAGDDDTVIVRGLKEGQRVLANPSIVREARITVWH